MKKLLSSAVVLTLFGCGSDPGYSVISRSNDTLSEARTTTPESPEAPRETIVALQTCVDHYAYRLSSDSYAVMFDIEATGSGGITAVKVKDSMVSGSDMEACLTRALEHMNVPDTAIHAQHVSSPSRSMVGVVQVAAAPIALLPIVLVAGGVTILVGVAIYVGAEVIEAARRRPKPSLNRCHDAAAGGETLWGEFCRDVGGAGDCWSKMYESEQNKRGWCNEKFGRW